MAALAVLLEVVGGLSPSDLVIAMAALFLFSCLRHRLTRRGPMHWPILGILPTLFLHLDNIYDWGTAVLARAGGTFPYHGMWLGGAHGVITSDPANVEYILRTNFANFPKGLYYRERFLDLLGDGIFNADDDLWRAQRRAAASEMRSPRFAAYSAESITKLVHRKLLPLISHLAAKGSPPPAADLQDIFLRFTFDNICVAAFGVDPGCLAVDDRLPEVEFARAFERATELTLVRFIVPPFVWKSMRLLGVGPERELKEAVGVVHDFAEKTVSQRRAELVNSGDDVLRERSDLLSRLVEATEGGGGDGGSRIFRFSDKFIKDFCISFILAGRDTSSVALAWFFWLLHDRPDVEANVLDDLHSIIKQRRRPPSSSDEVVFTMEEVGRMEYLHAALSEALRLYPPVPVDFKEAVEDDVLPDGTAVRRGARVIYSIYSMGRTEAVWGRDCGEFRPERWIGEGGRFEGESQFKYPVFNAGPRMCVGKRFAYVQMKMVAAAVVLRFKVVVVEGQAVVPKMNTTLYMKNGMLVTFKPREKKALHA